MSNVGELSLSLIQTSHIQVQNEKEKFFDVACWRPP